MASRKLNVLVYTGTGSTLESVRHCIYSLRRLLSPNYAVIPVSDTVLLKEPWPPTCALLVFPGGGDLGYCRVLNGAGNRIISQYVRRGGAYLGFCAGGYYGTKRCEFEIGNRELEVVGSRELGFFPGTCRGGAFKGFAYGSEVGARAARITVRKESFSGAGTVPSEFCCYYNGGGVFVDLEDSASANVEVLASYADDLNVDGGEAKAAAVYCTVGEGSAILTGPHPEFASVNLSAQPEVPGYASLMETLAADEESRTGFLKACLTKLGLEVSQESTPVPSLSPLHLSSSHYTEVGELLHSLQETISKEGEEEFIRGANDVFHLERPETRWSVDKLKQALDQNSDGDAHKTNTEAGQQKSIIPVVSHEEGWPEAKETPYFNHSLYYSSLEEYRGIDPEATEWGEILMYGEVVTSTNTLLEKNHNLLSKLSSGFLLAATTQIAGRGRGSNVWVSPAGSLIMSLVINHPAHLATSHPIVFVQYVAAIAIVEAIQTYGHGYKDVPVKLKWPNDIYALDPTKPASPPSYVKIGGILSNCAYSAGTYQIVLGIGLNTNNGRPTTSLDALIDPINRSRVSSGSPPLHPFHIERLLARITTRMEALYTEFCRTGFSAALEQRYYRHWLHTNQIVTLEAEGGVRARVVGITRDWGMLKAEELKEDGIGGALRSSGKIWALQSDENSFDFWKGLLKRKV